MSDQKIISVIGATGAQGGGLVRAIPTDPHGGFRARAITRDPPSPAAQPLTQQGAEVVAADIDDEARLTQALQGAYGTYCVTFFWTHCSPDKEQAEIRNMARAAKTAGVQQVIWSTLEDTRPWIPLSDPRMPTLMGQYPVPHFDAQGESNAVFTERGVPTTFLYTSFYWDNLIHFGMGPKCGPDGTLTFTLPMGDKKLPGMAAEDIGRCAYGLFQQGTASIGQSVGIAGEHLTGAAMAAALTQALGQPVHYHAISPDAYRALGFPGAEDLGNRFQFKHDLEALYWGRRDLTVSRTLNPARQTFAPWLEEHKSRISLDPILS